MIKNGTFRTIDKASDNSFRKTFGAVPVDPLSVPDFNYHYGPVPDQSLPNELFGIPAQPNGCTNYSTCALGNNEDKTLYNPGFQESITHASAAGGYDVRASLQTSIDWGLQKLGELASLAYKHKRAAIFRIGKNPDYFTGALTALVVSKRSITIGTPWFPQWTDAGTGNLHTYDPVTGTYTFTGGGVKTNIAVIPTAPYNNANTLPWHDWVICGKKTIGGVTYLLGEPHCGPDFADQGFLLFPAEVLNYAMNIPGTCMFTVAEVDPDTIQKVGHVFMRNLYYGVIDAEVQELQRNLVYLGYPIPHAVTSVFGSETRAALAAFQKANSIVDDGSHFGPQTRYSMNKTLNPAQTLYGSIVLFVHSFFGI